MMKRTLIAAAAVLAAGTAMAQSSVQIYGRVNTTVERQKESGTDAVYRMQNNASRWGLRGSEDIGGGLKGVFLLESGFASDTGASTGALFRRESWVGLQGNFGRLRLGNMGPTGAYFTTADYISMHNHDTGTSSDAFYLYPGVGQNMVSFNTASFGGLVVEAQFGLKETTSGGKNTAVLTANYDRGPVHLGAAYVNGPTDFTGLTFAGVPGGLLNDGKELGLRALVELGAFTVGAYAIRNEAEAAGGGEIKRNAYRLSGMYTLGAGEIHANVGFADDFKINGADLADSSALQYTLGYNHNLSKRTKVYAFYTRVNNDNNINYFTSAGGRDFSSIALGVRHNF